MVNKPDCHMTKGLSSPSGSSCETETTPTTAGEGWWCQRRRAPPPQSLCCCLRPSEQCGHGPIAARPLGPTARTYHGDERHLKTTTVKSRLKSVRNSPTAVCVFVCVSEHACVYRCSGIPVLLFDSWPSPPRCCPLQQGWSREATQGSDLLKGWKRRPGLGHSPSVTSTTTRWHTGC